MVYSYLRHGNSDKITIIINCNYKESVKSHDRLRLERGRRHLKIMQIKGNKAYRHPHLKNVAQEFKVGNLRVYEKDQFSQHYPTSGYVSDNRLTLDFSPHPARKSVRWDGV